MTYNVDEYNVYRKDAPLLTGHDRSMEKIHWNSTPPAQVAMQDYAVWYGPEVSFLHCSPMPETEYLFNQIALGALG